MNRILMVGALLGFLSVVVGAMSDHGSLSRLDADMLASVATAVRYHQLGALVIVALGLALRAGLPGSFARRLAISGWLFVAGTLLFSFSIYAAALSGVEALTYLTPIGGVTLMIAWLSLAWTAISAGTRDA